MRRDGCAQGLKRLGKLATAGLAVEVHNRPPGEVPHLRITREDGHPLQLEQEAGIDTHRLQELNSVLLHPAGP